MDLTELVKGTIPAITAQLSTLSVDDLAQLLALESAAASPRTGLLAAIKTEQEARGGDQTARDENDALIAANGQITDLTAQVSDLQGQVTTLTDANASLTEQVTHLTAVNTTLTAATLENDDLHQRIADLEEELQAAGMVAVVSNDGKAVSLIVGGDITNLTRVVFGDAHDKLLWQIPALQFDEDAFIAGSDGSVVLDRAISFPRFGPTSDVASAWLVGDATDAGLTGAVCRLVIPVGTGGGRAVDLPAGHLRFSTTA